MIQQRDVTERQLGVEECDECHVARIIGGANVRAWRQGDGLCMEGARRGPLFKFLWASLARPQICHTLVGFADECHWCSRQLVLLWGVDCWR